MHLVVHTVGLKAQVLFVRYILYLRAVPLVFVFYDNRYFSWEEFVTLYHFLSLMHNELTVVRLDVVYHATYSKTPTF